MTIVRTLGKGQIVIPKAIRIQFGIEPKTQLLLQVIRGGIVLKPLPKDPISALHGMLKEGGPSTADLLKERRKERERETREGA